MRQKLSIITLGVSDLARSIAFYRDGLKWHTTHKEGEGIAFFPMGGIVLSLYPREGLAEDALVGPHGSGFQGFTLAHNTKSEAEVDAVLAEVAALGMKIVKPAQKVFWGGYSGYFADPDGYLWEVACNPFVGFDEQDNLTLST
jgi:catechol 2,3-dioxygenase-like lactoylglutathione lyase family enzyme